jgi:hypothetical protein
LPRHKLHRESSLYLPCRFSQLSTEIPGDVLFRRMDPPKFHRESSLYLPCRFSQLSTEIPGDVLFRRMDPPKLLNLVRKSKKFTDLRRRIPAQSTSKLSSMACGSTVSRGYSQAGASETCGKRVQGHFSKDRPRSGPCPAALLAPVVAPWPSVPRHK